jgi:hypothetical protein
VALTPEQFRQLKEAVTNYRRLGQQLKGMETPSRKIIFQQAPHPSRRKRPSPKVAGII